MVQVGKVGYDIYMGVFGFLFIFSLVPVPGSAAGHGHYPFFACGFPFPDLLMQYEHIGACLTGPAEFVTSSSCTCADLDYDGHVSLRDFAVFQLAPLLVCTRYLTPSQEPGFGFCPTPGTIFRANVIRTLSGDLVLVGSLIEEGNPEVDVCLGYDFFGPTCYIGVPFPPLLLSPNEQLELSALLMRIPKSCETVCTDPSTDPCCKHPEKCVIRYLRHQGKWHDDFCYGCGNADEYRRAFRDVVEYLRALLIQP